MLSRDRFQPASLVFWKNKLMAKWTKAISLLITLAFILPTLGWSFDQSLLEEQVFVQTKLDGQGSRTLADRFRIAPYLGQLTEASYHQGGKTVVLIQDLHCNYEIQENIRGILNHLTERLPDLKLVAVEGASGIIPTLDLGLIPDTPIKQAVTDYYVRQGNLTGADHFTICDNKKVELYGAEDEGLYQKSLDLIRQFSTDENRGLLLDLMDQLQAVKASVYHHALAAFDRKDLAFQEGKLSEQDYRSVLLQTAKQEAINPLPGPLAVITQTRPLNYQEQQAQETYLEKALFQKLAQSPAEKQVLAMSTYLETADRILNIAAAPNDLPAYRQESRALSLKDVNAYLKKKLGFNYIDPGDDLKTLNQAMVKALSFYDLALQRNQTLCRQTLTRLAARHEQTAVLITGGFHTDKIAELLKSKGQSVVVIRPNLTKMQYSSNYYDLLLHPEQESPFEQAVAQAYRRTVAIGVMNQQVNMDFKQEFLRMLDISKRAAQMTIGQSVTLGSVVLTKVSQSMVQIKSALSSFYMNLKNPRGAATIEVQTAEQKAQAQPQSWILRLVKNRWIQFITIFTSSSSAYADGLQAMNLISNNAVGLGWFLAGVAALALGLVLVHYGKRIYQNITGTSQGILRSALLAGLLWLSPVSGGATSDYFQYAANRIGNENRPFLMTRMLIRIISKGLDILSFVFPMKLKESKRRGQIQLDLNRGLKTMPAILGRQMMTASGLYGAIPVAAALVSGTEKFFGTDPHGLFGTLAKAQRRLDDKVNNGNLVGPDWSGDTDHMIVVSKQDVAHMLDYLSAVGLGKIAEILTTIFYAEPKGGYQVELGPVAAQIVNQFSVAAFQEAGRSNSFNDPDVQKFVKAVYEKSESLGTENTDRLFIPQLIVRHLLNRRNYDRRIIKDLLPNELKKYLESTYGKGYYEKLFSEIIDPKNRAAIKANLDTILAETADDNFPITLDLATAIVKHSILHEIAHTLILHFPVKRPANLKNGKPFYTEKDLFRLLNANYQGRIDFKNWIKALKGTQTTRLRLAQNNSTFANPSDETQAAVFQGFMTEQACDTFAMYLMAKANKGEKHVYESVFDEALTPELTACYDWFLGFLKHFEGEDRLLVFNAAHMAESHMIEAMDVTNAAMVPEEKSGILWTAPGKILTANPFASAPTEPVVILETSSFVEGPTAEISDETPKRDLQTGDSVKHLKRRRRTGQAELELGSNKTTSFNKALRGSQNLGLTSAAAFVGEEKRASTTASLGAQYKANFQSIPTSQQVMPTNPMVQSQNTGKSGQSSKLIFDAGNNKSPIMGQRTMTPAEGPDDPSNFNIPPAVQEALIGNPDLLNAILGQPRVADIIGQARDLLTTVPEGQPITIGLDSPALTALLQKTISSLGQSNPAIYGRLASSVKIVSLPTGANITPQTFTSWAAGPSITVLTNPPTSASDYVTVRANANGQVGVGHQISAIPIQAIGGLEETVKNSLLDQHHQILSNLQNKQELKDYLLVNWKAVDSQNAQLLQNYDHQFTVTGYRQPTAAEQSQLLIPSLEAALKPAFSADQQEILVQINLAALNQVQAAVAKPDNIIMNFGPRNAMVAPQKELGYNLETAVLTQAFGAKGTALMPAEKQAAIDKYTQAVGLQLSPDPVVRALQDQELADFIQLLKGFSTVAVEMSPAHDLNGLENEARQPELMQDKIAEIRKAIAGTYSQKASEALSDNEVADIIGQLAMMDFRTVLGPVTSMLAALQRGEGRPWEEQPSLFRASNPLAYFKGVGRAPTAPGAVADLAVKIKETKHNVAKGISRFFSSILLAIVASAVIKDAIFAAMKAPRQDDVSWLSRFINFLGHPGLRQSLLLMAGIVVGRADVWDRLSPVIKAQLVDLQKLSNSGNDFTKMEKSELEQSYPSLKYDQASFKQLNNRMQRNTLFGFVFWMVKRFQKVDKNSLVGLYPEMFALLSTGNQMEDILWYYSPAQTFSNRVQGLTADVDLNGKPDSGIEKRLAENLSRGLDEARNALNDLTSQIEQAEPDKPVQGALLSQKRDLLFSIYLNRILEKLGEHNSVANVRLLIRLLLKEMSRPDVSVTYKEGILELLKVINPFDQAAYQINLGNNITEPVMLPLALTETALRDYLLLFFEVFDQQGEPMMPLRRIELRHGASA